MTLLKTHGPYSPTILKTILFLFLQDFEKFENITISDWLNQRHKYVYCMSLAKPYGCDTFKMFLNIEKSRFANVPRSLV